MESVLPPEASRGEVSGSDGAADRRERESQESRALGKRQRRRVIGQRRERMPRPIHDAASR